MNFYSRFPGDYSRDTAHLSLAEHGAYALLLDTYYSTEKPLPDDIDSLCRLCRAMTKDERVAVKSVVRQFFPHGDDGLRHNMRADKEISSALKRIETARQNGKSGGRRPSNKNPAGNPVGSGRVSQPASSPYPYSKSPIPEGDDLSGEVVVIPWGGRA